jgi:hypothetical protein
MIGKFRSALKDDTLREIVQSNINDGIHWCDMVEVYGWGASETAVTGENSKTCSDAESGRVNIFNPSE